ncbi:hypothetical protein B566_EDAN005344 [Ephemera danica]|nr:hypothetical protein B566_EDAN005344 [Ephemera danica]
MKHGSKALTTTMIGASLHVGCHGDESRTFEKGSLLLATTSAQSCTDCLAVQTSIMSPISRLAGLFGSQPRLCPRADVLEQSPPQGNNEPTLRRRRSWALLSFRHNKTKAQGPSDNGARLKAMFLEGRDHNRLSGTRQSLHNADGGKTDVTTINTSQASTKSTVVPATLPPHLLKELKHASAGCEAMAVLVQYLVHSMDAFSTPRLKAEVATAREEWVRTKLELEEAHASYRRLQETLSDEVAAHERREEARRVEHEETVAALVKQHAAALEAEQLERKKIDGIYRIEMEVHRNAKEAADHTVTSVMRQLAEARTQAARSAEESARREAELGEQLAKVSTELAEAKANTQKFWSTVNKDKDARLQVSVEQCQTLQKEVDSLHAVLELKSAELQSLRKVCATAQESAEKVPSLEVALAAARTKIEDLQSQLDSKINIERQLKDENKSLNESYMMEAQNTRRLTQDKEELQWKLKQSSEMFNKLASSNSRCLPDAHLTPVTEVSVEQCQTLQKEVDSLHAVLELKSAELQSLRKVCATAQESAEKVPSLEVALAAARTKIEDLQSQLDSKINIERQLKDENKSLNESYMMEAQNTRRLTQDKEELQWKLKQSSEMFNKLASSNSSFNNSMLFPISPLLARRSPNTSNGRLDDELPDSPRVTMMAEKTDSIAWRLDMEETVEAMVERVNSNHRQRCQDRSSPGRSLPKKSASTSAILSEQRGKLAGRKSRLNRAFTTSTPAPDTRCRSRSVSTDSESLELEAKSCSSQPERRENGMSESKIEQSLTLPSQSNSQSTATSPSSMLTLPFKIQLQPQEGAGEAMISEEISDDAQSDCEANQAACSGRSSESSSLVLANGAQLDDDDDDDEEEDVEEEVQQQMPAANNNNTRLICPAQNLRSSPTLDSVSQLGLTDNTAMDLSWSEDFELFPSECEG